MTSRIIIGFLMLFALATTAASAQSLPPLTFGSNEHVVFRVEISGNRVVGGYHRNDYTGRSWLITGGSLQGANLTLNFYDPNTSTCDRQLFDTFYLGRQAVTFQTSRDVCGHFAQVNAQFGYMDVVTVHSGR